MEYKTNDIRRGDYSVVFNLKPKFDTIYFDKKLTKLEAEKIFNGESKSEEYFKNPKLGYFKNKSEIQKFKLENLIRFGSKLEREKYFEELTHKITKYGSIAMYIMMPLSTLFLFVLFYKRQKFYFPHFLFSMHLHTFIFICISVAIVLSSIVYNSSMDTDLIGWIGLIFSIGIYFYYYKAQKNFYGTSRWKTILEGGVTAMFYFITFFFLVVGIFGAAFMF